MDMGDLFGIGIPQEWTELVMLQIRRCLQHRFYLLTKQPQNLVKYSPFPDNCWVGVSATNQTQLAQALYVGLARIEAKVKFLSLEPLLERLRLKSVDFRDAGISWIIIGAQTKPPFYPPEAYFGGLEQDADEAGIPVFEKNNLVRNWQCTRPRQEMPG